MHPLDTIVILAFKQQTSFCYQFCYLCFTNSEVKPVDVFYIREPSGFKLSALQDTVPVLLSDAGRQRE